MERAQLAPPLFESRRGVFRVTLFNKRLASSKKEIGMLPKSMRKILAFCTRPRSRNEIAQLLEIDTPSYVEMGKLKLTLPNTPKSKNQKYVTVREAE